MRASGKMFIIEILIATTSTITIGSLEEQSFSLN